MLSGIKAFFTGSHDSEGRSDGSPHETSQTTPTTKSGATTPHKSHEESSMTAVKLKRIPFGNSIAELDHSTPNSAIEVGAHVQTIPAQPSDSMSNECALADYL